MEKVILFQGDSITDGNRYKDKKDEWDLNHQMGHGYAYMINGKLGLEYMDKNLKFVNKGISGNRIVDLYARLKEDLINIKPDILSILIGVNEICHEMDNGCGTEAVKFERVYRLIIEEVKEKLPNTKIVLCEPFLLPVQRVGENFEAWQSMMKPMQEIVRRLSREYNLIFVPLQDKFNSLCEYREPSYWIWDGVHPTVCGHEVIAEEWIKEVKKHNII